MSDGFAMELCGTQGSIKSCQTVSTIDLDTVGAQLKRLDLKSGSVHVCAGRFRGVVK